MVPAGTLNLRALGHYRPRFYQALGEKVRKRLTKKGGAGLVSAVAPVAVGVLLAYAWNAAGATRADELPQARVPAPYVGVAAEQAAAQAWARITPAASVGSSPSTGARSAGGPLGSPGGQRGTTGVEPHVTPSPGCTRTTAPYPRKTVGVYGTPAPSASAIAIAAPAVTVIPLAAVSGIPSSPVPASHRPGPVASARSEPQAKNWPGRAE